MFAKISKLFCCDLLSIAMGKLPENSAWVTVMANINTLAVAMLAEAACIIFAENYGSFRAEDGLANGDISCGFVPETLPDCSAYGWAWNTFALSVRMGEVGHAR